MKQFFLLISMLMILSGCATKQQSTDTKIYSSSSGDVEIPSNPSRIVTDYYTGQLLSLQAPLVGADLTYVSPAWDTKLQGVTDVGQSAETIASLNPDLIVTFNQEAYPQYQTIAPTVLIPYGEYDEEQIVIELGEIISKEKEAEDIVNEYNQQVELLSAKITDSTKTYSIMEFLGNDLYVYGNNFGRLGHVIYDKLDLKGTKKAEEILLVQEDSYLLLTQETIKDYTGDILIMSTIDAKPVNNSFTQSNGFKDATKNSDIHYVDSNLFYHTDMLSIFEQMKVFEEIISE